MTHPSPRRTSRPDISAAIQRVYREAGLDATGGRSGVVPLYQLIGAFPLRVAELRGLTYRSARDFLVKETNQQIPLPEEGDRKLAGFLYLYRYANLFYGCVLVNQEDPVARRRFSVAHELGHYVLHFLPLLQQSENRSPCIITEGLATPDEDEDAAPPLGGIRLTSTVTFATEGPELDLDTMEEEANQFAAELLMPEGAIRLLAERYRRETGARRSVLARRLASEFLVSGQAMTRRLEALGLPTPAGVPVAGGIRPLAEG